MLRRHFVLLIVIHPLDGDIKPGCPVGDYQHSRLYAGTRYSPSPFLHHSTYNMNSMPTSSCWSLTHWPLSQTVHPLIQDKAQQAYTPGGTRSRTLHVWGSGWTYSHKEHGGFISTRKMAWVFPECWGLTLMQVDQVLPSRHAAPHWHWFFQIQVTCPGTDRWSTLQLPPTSGRHCTAYVVPRPPLYKAHCTVSMATRHS